MFRGINAINLDAKGRLAIPARYRGRIRDDAQGRLIVTIDTEQPCLLLYPLPVWEEIEQKIVNLPSFHPETRRIQRLLIGHATEANMDGNGRVLLPPLLRDYASIDKRVILLGQGNKFEIWDEKRWQECRDKWLASDLAKREELPEELRSISL